MRDLAATLNASPLSLMDRSLISELEAEVKVGKDREEKNKVIIAKKQEQIERANEEIEAKVKELIEAERAWGERVRSIEESERKEKALRGKVQQENETLKTEYATMKACAI